MDPRFEQRCRAGAPRSYSGTPQCLLAAGAALLASAAHAQTQAQPPATGPSLTPLLFGLVLVLALIPAAAWLLRRAGLAQPGSSSGLRVVAQLPLGPRDRIVIVEVADRRWLLGVSPSGIRRLGTLPPGTDAGAPPAAPSERSFSDIIRRLGASR
jgi:flagellar protein FliO/FliZ